MFFNCQTLQEAPQLYSTVSPISDDWWRHGYKGLAIWAQCGITLISHVIFRFRGWWAEAGEFTLQLYFSLCGIWRQNRYNLSMLLEVKRVVSLGLVAERIMTGNLLAVTKSISWRASSENLSFLELVSTTSKQDKVFQNIRN